MNTTKSAENNVADYSFGRDNKDLSDFLGASLQNLNNLRQGPELIPQFSSLPVNNFHYTKRYLLTYHFFIYKIGHIVIFQD
jgi:hypothetical protein